ncbi:MAG: hypothetical protein FJ267_00560 [Planctomycetes bacterium]|nr:hypothetical protein [Planctomycetota bacterium]
MPFLNLNFARLIRSLFNQVQLERRRGRRRLSRENQRHSSNHSAFVQCLEPRVVLSAGTLDTTFGTAGVVTTEFFANPNTYEGGAGLAIQPDGKMIVLGEMGSLSRYNTDGSLDLSFGSNGFSHVGMIASALEIQSDGKILVAGVPQGASGGDFGLARFNSDGSLDGTFDGDGKLTTDFFGRNDGATSIAIQSDGRIVVAGSAEAALPGTGSYFAVAVYNPDGSLDSSFDGDGKVTTDVIPNQFDFAASVAIQQDGKIIAGGHSSDGTLLHMSLVRYLSNGELDTTFDNDGILITSISSNSSTIEGIAIQDDGRIVVTGRSFPSGSTAGSVVIARYESNGILDSTFDTDGLLVTNFGLGTVSGFDVTVGSDGRIVVAGTQTISSTDTDMIVARLLANGILDTSFNSTGVKTISFGASTMDSAADVALLPDGRVVVSGTSQTTSRRLASI